MNEKLQGFFTKIKGSWGSISGKTKGLIIGSFLITLVLLSVFIFMNSRTSFVPIYTDLSAAEAGEIKAAIEGKGIPVELSPDGSTIQVPKEQVSSLKVTLAAEGIPQSGNVNYSIFSENMGLGMTDRHFDVVERDAMQNELATLIKQIDGVKQANVMITLPKENIWITDEEQTATASVVIQGEPAFKLDQKQVNGLYHLISKSVPSLPTDQIVIMNQNGQAYEMLDESQLSNTALSAYQQQREIRKDIEKDLQSELQQMLGLILGRDKVVVSVTASIDFTKEKREEQLVEPVNQETNEGIEISVERIQETYSSEGAPIVDSTGAGETEIANYPGVDNGGTSQSERTEERINREVNRINRQIEMSPYVIDDLTINVGVEPPNPDNPASLTPQNIEDIQTLLKNTVSTTLSMNGNLVSEEDLENRISVFAAEFQGKAEVPVIEQEKSLLDSIPTDALWIAAAAAVLLAIILITILVVVLRRKNRKIVEEEEEFNMQEMFEAARAQYRKPQPEEEEEEIDLSELKTKANPKRKTIEKLAKERPDDFAKLIRTWMSEE